MTKLKLGISAIVVAGAAATLVIQHQTQNKLTDDNLSLRQQMGLLQNDNERLSNLVAQVSNTPSRTDDQLLELLRLRGEVRLLHAQTNELGNVREENRQLKIAQKSQSAKSPPTVSKTDFPRDSWRFAGYASPEAAMETWVWAMDKGDKKTMLASVPPEQQDTLRKVLEGSASDADLAKGSPFIAYHIVSTEAISDTEIALTIVSDFPDDRKTGEQKMKIEKIGTDWKIAGEAANQ